MNRITRHDMPLKTGIEQPAAPRTSSQAKTVPAETPQSAPETLSTRLGRIFTGNGVEVSPSQLKSIVAELTALGIAPGDLDGTTALHALLLASHDIPLDSALLFPDNQQSQSVLPEIVSLLANAKPLLAGGRLSGEARAVVEQFVQRISVLFRFDAADDPAVADAARISATLQKSGLSFEWRLLSWYRAGRDPMMLRMLVEDDLKGVLASFLERLRKRGAWKKSAGKNLDKLEQSVESVLKNMTNRQLTNILDSHVNRRGFAFELPFGHGPGEGHARVVAKGGDDASEDGNITPDNFTLSFEVDTTNLGTVTAFMTVAGKSVSLRVELDDGSFVSLGNEMDSELRDALVDHGFAVGDITFAERGELPVSPSKQTKPSTQLDIRG